MSAKLDLSLLRPFDLAMAKAGARLTDGSSVFSYVAGPGPDDEICVQDDAGMLFVETVSLFRRAPLCWVEGKPVYKGDTLFSAGKQLPEMNDRALVAESFVEGDSLPLCVVAKFGIGRYKTLPDCVAWTRPVQTVKREGWINIYPAGREDIAAGVSHAYATEADAKLDAGTALLACIRIEWEQPA